MWKFHVPIYNTVGDISRQRTTWSGRVVLEMDSGHKNENISLYPKSIRTILGFYALSIFLLYICALSYSLYHIYICFSNHIIITWCYLKQLKNNYQYNKQSTRVWKIRQDCFHLNLFYLPQCESPDLLITMSTWRVNTCLGNEPCKEPH